MAYWEAIQIINLPGIMKEMSAQFVSDFEAFMILEASQIQFLKPLHVTEGMWISTLLILWHALFSVQHPVISQG
jgi:hypothetical protein